MKNSKQIVKQVLLRRKIDEAFQKNPNKKSVVVVFGEGNDKIYWKATKSEKGNISVVEVKTNKSNFNLCEALPGAVSSPSYAKAISQATEAIQSTDTGKIKMAMDTIQRELKNTALNDAQRASLGALNGALTNLQNELAKQGPGNVRQVGQTPSFKTPPPPAATKGAPPSINASKKVKGKVVKEADKSGEEQKKDNEPVDTDVSVKQDKPTDVPATDVNPEGDQEETAINKALSGKSIKSASLQMGKDGNSGVITLIPDTKIPIKIKWAPGKVTLFDGNKPIKIS